MLAPSFEREIRRIFHPLRGEIVVDIGAHIGLYTLISAQAVGG